MENTINFKNMVVNVSTDAVKFHEDRGFAYFTGASYEDEYAVWYHGKVQFLTHEEMVAIIRGNGQDYDIAPSDWTGPMTRKRELRSIVLPSELGLAVIEEWDGTLGVVKYKLVEQNVMAMMYYDTCVTHEVALSYFESILAKKEPLPRVDNGYW